MDFVANQGPQAFIDKLMARKRAQAVKFRGYDKRLEVRSVLAHYFDDGIVKAGLDQLCDFGGVHVLLCARKLGARSVKQSGPHPNHVRRFVYHIRPFQLRFRMLENSLLVVAGLVLLIWGADRFVHGAAATARNLGVAPLLIGLTVVAFATSAPEILVSVVAALQGQPGLAFGNAIGSNIVNVGLVLGLTAMIRPILLESATLRREMPALLAVTLLTVSLFLDSFLSRIDGIVMLTGLVIVMVWLTRLGLRSAANDPIAQDYEAEIPSDVSMPMAIIWLIVGFGTLLIGAELLVDGAIGIAKMLQISDVVIGITIVAFGTSLPELAVSLASALKGEYGLAIGNIVGSNIFNLLAVIGVAATIEPASLPPSVLSLHIFVMVAFTLVLFAMTYDYDGKAQLSRLEGLALLMAFLAYDGYVIAQNL